MNSFAVKYAPVGVAFRATTFKSAVTKYFFPGVVDIFCKIYSSFVSPLIFPNILFLSVTIVETPQGFIVHFDLLETILPSKSPSATRFNSLFTFSAVTSSLTVDSFSISAVATPLGSSTPFSTVVSSLTVDSFSISAVATPLGSSISAVLLLLITSVLVTSAADTELPKYKAVPTKTEATPTLNFLIEYF